MCKIIVLEPGWTLPLNMLENAVWNNPHGYGLILRDLVEKKTSVIRKCDPDKANDPEEVYDLLKDNEDKQRILHLRWKTEGTINLENTHPFQVYDKEGDRKWFMHNGTLSRFAPPMSYTNGVRTMTGPEVSDSRKFAEDILRPGLALTNGDVSNPFLGKCITEFWGAASHNKGVIIPENTDQSLFFINRAGWDKVKSGDTEFWASNNTYFLKVTRGPEYERREKERKAIEEANKVLPRFRSPITDIIPLRNLDIKYAGTLSQPIINLMQGADTWSDEGLASLQNLTDIEIESFVKNHPDESASLLIYLTCSFAALFKRYQKAAGHLKSIKAREEEETT